MARREVTDPAMLAQLNAGALPKRREVTDARILEELERPARDAEQKSRAQAAAREAVGEPGKLRSFSQGIGQGVTFGFGDEVTGGLGALLSYPLQPFAVKDSMVDAVKGRSFGDRYRYFREVGRESDRIAHEANPKSYVAGEVVGAVAPTLASGGGTAAARGGVAAAKGATMGAKLLAGGKAIGSAAAQGAAYGLGAGESDLTRGDVSGAAGDAATGAAYGVAGLGAGKLAGGVAKAGWNAVKGAVKPTAAAQYLMSKGVPLTIGQMNPEGALAHLEEASTSLPLMKAATEGQRGAARAAWQNAVHNEGRAPGMALLNEGASHSDRLAAAYKGFEPAYAPVKSAPVHTESGSLSKALRGAVDDQDVMADDATRKMVGRFVDNQMTKLKGKQPTAEALMNVRSKIRDAASDAMKREDHAAEALLSNAEQAVTDAIQANLPDELGNTLRAVDKQYSKHKIVEKVVASAKNSPNGFTPTQLETSLSQSMSKGKYARGEGGELRKLADAGREALDTRTPITGARLLAMPLGAVSPVLNLDPVKRVLIGATAPQQKARALGKALSRRVGPGANRRLTAAQRRAAALLGTGTRPETAETRALFANREE